MKRLLLVEDEPNQRMLIRETLEEEGYIVDEAPTGAEALAAVRRQRPDLVVLDIVLSGTDGTELLDTLTDIDTSLTVVIYTGYHELYCELSTCGADAYLLKRSDLSELSEVIKRLLDSA